MTISRTTDSGSALRYRLALMLMTASGFAALGYQIVWTQQSALWLGHEAAGMLAVVAAFFGGLALGALVAGPRIEHSHKPAWWYAGCEVLICLWSLALVFLMTPVTGWLLNLIGPQPTPVHHWTVAFAGVFILLLPATAAMGATLPAMERALAPLQQTGSSIAALYAGNTLGAVLGVLVAAFWLVPSHGLLFTAGLCAVLNLLCAILALVLFADLPAAIPAASRVTGHRLLPTLMATGLLGIGYEVLVVRVLSQVAENTVYTFAIMLAVYLVGTALGAALYSRRVPALNRTEHLLDRFLQCLAIACLIGILGLAQAGDIKTWMLQLLGQGMVNALMAEVLLALAAFLFPTIVMGALFSHLATQARAAGIGFGRVLGVNTLGAALAPLVFGVVLVTSAGIRYALLLVVAGYLLLVSLRAWSRAGQLTAVGLTVVLAWWAPSLAIIDVPTGGRLVSHTEGALATVSIVEDAHGVATLHINNRQQEGSTATRFADARQALLPILLHPSPQRVLFLGLGTGVTSAAATQDPTLQVDVVELLPEVIDASAYFTDAMGSETGAAHRRVMAADARRFIRASHERYDVVIADNFHPARSGSGALYTVEHFQAVQERLNAGGLFCQWLPLHQLDLATLASIVRSFLHVYPRGGALLATNSLETPVVGLVSLRDGGSFPLDVLNQRLATTPLRPEIFGLPDDLALLGSFIAGPRALAVFAADAPLNTDDHPIVAYRAPRITYMPDSLPRDRLLSLLQTVDIHPDELVDMRIPVPRDTEGRKRLQAYWSARNQYLHVGRNIAPTADVRRMLAQVRDPLLSILRISPDFRPAYDPLLQMALALGHSDAVVARSLLLELQNIQPLRPEATQALRDLVSEMP